MRDAPFAVFDGEPHADTAHAGEPALDHDAAAVARGEPLVTMNWKTGDALPEHLRPAPGEASGINLGATDPAALAPWPRPAEPDADITRAFPHGIAAAMAENGEPWPQPVANPASYSGPFPEPAPTPQPDTERALRIQTDEETAGGRIVGVTSGFFCRICQREAKIWAMEPGDTRSRDACCLECLAGIDNIVGKVGNEMAEQALTQMEKKAIEDARLDLYNALVAAGIADRFNDATAAQMDSVIKSVWDGVRNSMQRQSAAGEIPF